jgi:serine/threonine-protein phosphatase 2A regulatory subunit A
MIRRAVASGLGKLSGKMKSDMFITEMLPVLKNLVNDDQDSVRMLCIDSIVQISKIFTKELNKTNIIPILIHMIRDRAWKVRIKISNNFANLADAMSTEIADGSLLNIFASLLSDPEGEVRTAAIQNFAKFLKLVSPNKYSTVANMIMDLTKDTVTQVRVAAFEVLAIVAQGLSKDEVKSKLVDSIMASTKQEAEFEVKIEHMKALTACGIAVGSDFYTKLSNNDITNLLKEKNWRVRKEVYTMLAEVAVKIGSNQLFEVHFQDFFLSYLNDQVYQVRMHGNGLLAVREIDVSGSSRLSHQAGSP